MKQFKSTSFLALMLCVLIGYFEPANAAKSFRVAEPTSAYVAMNSTTNSCPFWPNPVAPGAVITTISVDLPTSAYLQNQGGKQFSVSIAAYNQPFPLGVVENNQYFPVDQYNSLSGTTLNIPTLSDGTYILSVTTKSGSTYSTKVTFSSK